MIDDLDNTEGRFTLHWADTPTMFFPKCFVCGEQVDFTWGAHYVTLTPTGNKGISIHSDCFSNLIDSSINFREFFMNDEVDEEAITH